MRKILVNGPGLLIGIPTLGRPVILDWALAFKALNPPINYSVNFSIVKGQGVADARNAFAQQAIEKDCKYLFFLGDDVIVPPHTLGQLIFRMENDSSLGVVGGVYCSKTDIPYPLIFKGNGQGAYWDWKIGEFFECTGMGMDCTLIRAEVFSVLSKPWFKTVDENQYLDAINKAESWTEDLYFCKKVLEETDYKIKIDTSVMCEHFDVYSGRIYTLPKNSLPYRQKVTTKDKKCLMLGPLIDLNDESYDIVRCDDQDPSVDYRCALDNLPFEEKQFDWVIITKHQVDIGLKGIAEWQRVCKGKISINIHPLLKIDEMAKLFNAKSDGTFIEMECQSSI